MVPLAFFGWYWNVNWPLFATVLKCPSMLRKGQSLFFNPQMHVSWHCRAFEDKYTSTFEQILESLKTFFVLYFLKFWVTNFLPISKDIIVVLWDCGRESKCHVLFRNGWVTLNMCWIINTSKRTTHSSFYSLIYMYLSYPK